MSKRMPVLAGVISVALIAGGGALAAPVAGNLLIADLFDGRVRQVSG